MWAFLIKRVLHWRLLDMRFYDIDTNEIPGFSFYLKIISSSRVVKILFLSFTCKDIGVAMVTNMVSQNFSLLHSNFDFFEQKI